MPVKKCSFVKIIPMYNIRRLSIVASISLANSNSMSSSVNFRREKRTHIIITLSCCTDLRWKGTGALKPDTRLISWCWRGRGSNPRHRSAWETAWWLAVHSARGEGINFNPALSRPNPKSISQGYIYIFFPIHLPFCNFLSFSFIFSLPLFTYTSWVISHSRRHLSPRSFFFPLCSMLIFQFMRRLIPSLLSLFSLLAGVWCSRDCVTAT